MPNQVQMTKIQNYFCTAGSIVRARGEAVEPNCLLLFTFRLHSPLL